MRIKYFAYLRDVTRVAEEQYTTTAATAGALLDELCRRYGPPFAKWVLKPDGSLSEIAIILVNGRDIRDGVWAETPIAPGDDICIFPPVAGG